MYLLDANVLITAKDTYYPIARVPEFWEWLVHAGERGQLKVPYEIMSEITGGSDELSDWLSDPNRRDSLLLNEEVNMGVVQVVLERYAPDLNEAELIKIGQDPFLISYAFAHFPDWTVVTAEASKPTTTRANRRVPDVCTSLGVPWCNSFALIRHLDFATAWRGR
ncbi:DUF4411 family protein [Xanthobacteraceae bacterium A53D]